MNTIRCAHCDGTGKEIDSVSLTTGLTKFRLCGVCKGSGQVSADRSHFTEYPDKSLEYAQQLMRQHGKPQRILIAGNHDIRITFLGGQQYILGGFTVGYRGTGPEYSKALFDSAGFKISMDEVAEMKPPVDLVAGQPYLAPKTLLFEGPSLEEAKAKAQESIPVGAKLIKLEIIRDGAPVTLEGEGTSEEAALQEVRSRVPKDGSISEQRVTGTLRKTVDGSAPSELLAIEDAKRRIPTGATFEKEVVQKGESGTVTVQSFAAAEATAAAQTQAPAGATMQAVVCLKPASKGFIGIGRKPADYQVPWNVPWKIRLTFSLTKVAVSYKLKPAVKVMFQEEAESPKVLPEVDQNSDAVVVRNGLMWQKESDGVERTQQDAFAYCRSLSLGGHSDWRLPTLEEFRGGGNALARGDNWTSSAESRLSDKVAYINDGTTMFKTNEYRVLAVRDL